MVATVVVDVAIVGANDFAGDVRGVRGLDFVSRRCGLGRPERHFAFDRGVAVALRLRTDLGSAENTLWRGFAGVAETRTTGAVRGWRQFVVGLFSVRRRWHGVFPVCYQKGISS